MLAWSGPIKRQNSGSRQQAAAVLGSTLRPSARAGAGLGPGRELRPDKTCAHLPATARPLPGCHWPVAWSGGQPLNTSAILR